MRMLMMKIRIVRMSMPDRRMGVLMRVSLADRPWEVVLVLVMLVVHMCVSMCQRLVFVLVAVLFSHVEHDADQHQGTSEQQTRRQRFTQDCKRERCPNEGSSREIRSCTRCAESPQRQDE